MTWIYYVKEPQHWVSSEPSGYFIVQEEDKNGRSKYAVYKGDFENWRGISDGHSPLESLGKFTTLRDAKQNAALETSK
jgi:hypothetical protein